MATSRRGVLVNQAFVSIPHALGATPTSDEKSLHSVQVLIHSGARMAKANTDRKPIIWMGSSLNDIKGSRIFFGERKVKRQGTNSTGSSQGSNQMIGAPSTR